MQNRNRVLAPLVIACGLWGSHWLHAGTSAESEATGARLDHVSRAAIQAISDQIDSLVEKKLADVDQQPHRRVDDQRFLRRVYLDIVGRIPTLEEARRFLTSHDADKRADLIDQLLVSPGYVSHNFNFWADILRIKNRLQGGNPGAPYIDFVKASIANGMPYDQFVRELLTSEGSALSRGNGATGYYLRDVGMPEDNMANTVRIFLGTRIECAQCHDHPFDKWSQRDFFEMVAFTGGLQTRMAPNGRNRGFQMRRTIRESDAPARVKQVAQNLLRPLSYGVSGGGTGLARLPDSYQYDDGEPNEVVKAKTLFDDLPLVHPTIPASRSLPRFQRRGRNANRIPGAKDIQSREAFASWLTSPDNPRFNQVIANRMWKKALGLALIEPLDDLNDESTASHPPLMQYLEQQMVELGYDLRQFQRAIYYTATYQREASSEDDVDPTKYHFPGPLLRRMSAEQIWDSFVTLATPDVDTRTNPRQRMGRYLMGADLYESFEKVKDMSVEEILALAEQQTAMRDNPELRRARVREAMMEMREEDPFAEEARDLRRRMTRLKQMQNRARQNRRPGIVRAMQQQIQEVQKLLRHTPVGQRGDLVRASELPSPAPAGHFLREFGQSDRDQIENAHAEPAVTQVLSLMNGQIEQKIIGNPRTILMRNVVLSESPQDKIDTIFLSMLSRYPTRSERRTWIKAGQEHGAEAAHDLIWTLANTSEFMFIQ